MAGEISDSQPRAVVIGGGTGAPASIHALFKLGYAVDAVVAMADDGGSTGLLRAAADVTPPGDIRKCLVAMAQDQDDPLVQAFARRFSYVQEHALGNLMLVALEDATGNFMEAVRICERLLGARGHVLPSTLCKVRMRAVTDEGDAIEGQTAACHADERLRNIVLTGDGDITAYPPAIQAIAAADLVVLGPGSLYTSILVNLRVPGIVEALNNTSAQVVFVCGLADCQGETLGMDVRDCCRALRACGLTHLDGVIAGDPGLFQGNSSGYEPLAITEQDVQKLVSQGSRVILADLARQDEFTWHDPAKLAAALQEVTGRCPSPQR